ncbi:MAG: UDP-N-acetylglucosamine--N-acetylmuramyl-(pentapeptide) pyrophosphoryl-undecaprenol N-acetylglucosamine transferase [Verrucomicrobia bacterium]|nr:UDP-N-acetylglucosamine--N-acetylmuramyl-(pentapeptide) pyrophosphoryl-undecaprenol N-acetylglucosamine transferase [Verrucomicrobiota bacterium]
MRKKILLAVGGTGGHLFPAQALARDLKKLQSEIQILFGGGRLGSNHFFQKNQFPFREVTSGTPFRGKLLKSCLQIGRGLIESHDLIKEFCPDLVIGFGSFYSFPILAIAKLKGIPFILVESNVLPGRVNKLFSSGALFSAIQYEETAAILKGKSIPTKMPFWSHEFAGIPLAQADARKGYGLDPEVFTLLIFGGSQGAEVINNAATELKLDIPFQVLHFCGRDQDTEKVASRYRERGIRAHVKHFEEQMHLAWQAANLAVCRAGAGTMAEMELFNVPAVLIPWPGATDQHQHRNAKIMEEIGGALLLEEKKIHTLGNQIQSLLAKLPQMGENLKIYRAREIEHLAPLVLNFLEKR